MLTSIFNDCGLKLISSMPVHGGDINKAFCLHTADGRYFLKVNDDASYPGMFEKEAEGLNALRNGSGFKVPAVIKNGVVDSRQYLLLEWLDHGDLTANTWEEFGRELALMHRQPQSSFGWETDNYIGSLQQRNAQQENWAAFFAECRVLPLVKRLFDDGSFAKHDRLNAEKLCTRTLFPEEPPSLLHGDLWSGNFTIVANGQVAIYDPAVYCGHREMDIGMTLLFGSFDRRFYEAYNEVYPLTAGWKERLLLSQLYPLLVHAILFGGHYVGQARELIRRSL